MIYVPIKSPSCAIAWNSFFVLLCIIPFSCPFCRSLQEFLLSQNITFSVCRFTLRRLQWRGRCQRVWLSVDYHCPIRAIVISHPRAVPRHLPIACFEVKGGNVGPDTKGRKGFTLSSDTEYIFDVPSTISLCPMTWGLAPKVWILPFISE